MKKILYYLNPLNWFRESPKTDNSIETIKKQPINDNTYPKDDIIEGVVDECLEKFGNRETDTNLVDWLLQHEALTGSGYFDIRARYLSVKLFIKKIDYITLDEASSAAKYNILGSDIAWGKVLEIEQQWGNLEIPFGKIKCNLPITLKTKQWMALINHLGLYCLIHLFEDKNFDGISSLERILRIEKEIKDEKENIEGLIYFFSHGEGRDYLKDSRICKALNRLAYNMQHDKYDVSQALLSVLEPHIEVYNMLLNEDYEDFLVWLEKQPKELSDAFFLNKEKRDEDNKAEQRKSDINLSAARVIALR